MKLETTEVGLQVYNGSNLSGHYELTNGQFLIPYSELPWNHSIGQIHLIEIFQVVVY